MTAGDRAEIVEIPGCQSPASDSDGKGTLQLTRAFLPGQTGGVFTAKPVPFDRVIDLSFVTHQYGGNGADGFSLALAAVDDTGKTIDVMGPSGGALGYMAGGDLEGLPNAYLGLGLDVYGNFGSARNQGSDCAMTDFPREMRQNVSIRGPGNKLAGYCLLATTQFPLGPSLMGTTRSDAAVPVEFVANPTSNSYTTQSGGVVAPGGWSVTVEDLRHSEPVHLSGQLPSASGHIDPALLTEKGWPRRVTFGWMGTTGNDTDTIEVSSP
jgi:hypothetical protein